MKAPSTYPPPSFAAAMERTPKSMPRHTIEVIEGEFSGCRGEIKAAAFVDDALNVAYLVHVVYAGAVYALAVDAEAVRWVA